MKILCVGDPHGNKKVLNIKVKDADLVLIVGDLGDSEVVRKYYLKYVVGLKKRNWKDFISRKELKDLYVQMIDSSVKVLKHFSKKPVFFVFGNLMEVRTENIKKADKKHGIKLQTFESKISKLKDIKNIGYKVINFKGLKIAGLPFFRDMDWIKRFKSRNKDLISYAKKEEPVAKKFLKNLDKVDILLTHVPPYGVLDKVSFEKAPEHWKGKHGGSKDLLKYIKKKQPRLVLCGHIHEGKGEAMVGKTRVINLGALGDHRMVEIK